MVYKWKTPFFYKGINAQAAGELFSSLEAQGELTAKRVVEESRPEDALLHKAFDWDDQKAADRWREQQARVMIGNIVTLEAVETSPGELAPVTVRCFNNLDSSGKGKYHSLNVILQNPDMTESLLKSARSDMESFVSKYQTLDALSGVTSAMKEVLKAGTA